MERNLSINVEIKKIHRCGGVFLSRCKKVSRHLQLQLELHLDLFADVERKEEQGNFLEVWSKSFFPEKVINKNDPFLPNPNLDSII